MAKKARRVRRKQGRSPRLSPAQMVRPVEQNQTTEAVPMVAQVARVRSADAYRQTVDLREEYQYVIADLKRIGMLALVMLVMLIGLALVLT